MRLNAITLALGLVSIVGLSGCDDDDTTVSTTTPSETPSTPSSPAETTKYSVTAIDGYLRHARIWLDLNGNYVLDDGEPNAISGDGGVADLDVTDVDNPEQYPVVVQAISGQTIDEDEPDVTVSDDYIMSAPPGEKDVTPLSTLVHVLIEQNTTDSDDAAAVEAAKQAAIQQVADQLGLDEDEILGDFVESGVEAAAYAAENLVDSNVLPSSPQELQEVAESEDKGTKFISVTASVNNEIKKKIEEVAGDSDKTFDNVGGATEGVDFSNDTDDDGVPNDLDDFPNDPNESLDSDGDEIGNNADLNDDTVDGEDDIYPDANDAFPTDRSRAGDHDSDGVDSIDDVFPQDPTEWADNDSDGYGDNQDVFDNDPTEWADTDGDGVGNNADEFPSDPNESLDTDGDGVGNNADEFPTDATEWADTDDDGLGDNEDDPYPNDTDNDSYNNDVDEFPTDATEWVDVDGDGVGNNADVHPEDGNKSIADVVANVSATDVAVLNITDRDIITLDIEVEEMVETLNSGEIVTTITTQYITADDVVYGTTQSVDHLLNDDFTRIQTFAYDYNLDGTARYEGMSLEIGTRTETSETYWRYIDEGDASLEGGFGGNGRVYEQGVALTSRVHPNDLSQIDTIHSVSVEFEDVAEGVQAVETLTEYTVNGFDIDDVQTHQAQWAQTLTTVTQDYVQSFVESKQDWGADGYINVELRFNNIPDGSYVYEYSTPIWANPQDGEFHEYADFNFNDGKWDDLTAYWNYYRKEVLINGDVLESGERSVLNEETNTLLIVDSDPINTLFQEWNAVSRSVSDVEKNKHIEWQHYPLTDYSFTTDTDNVGQAYRVYQKQSNGLWVATSFDEWGTQAVVDLPQQVEDARVAGTELELIDDQIIPGLSRYATLLPTSSFQYDDNGAIQWHVVTQDYLFTDTGIPTLVTLDLGDSGVVPGSFTGVNDVDMVLMVPVVDNPWSWYDAYYRRGIDTWGMDLTEGDFSWNNSLGMFFLNETAAQDYLTQVLNQDSDDDGFKDYEDAFPNDPNEWDDSDGDYVGDNSDAFPYDSLEWADSDSDGLGDNHENATEGLDPNNADSDEDGVYDGEDLYPTDPNKWTITAQEFAEQEGTLYGFFSDWSELSFVDILFKETLSYGGDTLTLTELIQYRGDQSFIQLPLEAEGDVQLTENGWQTPVGYTIDFSGEQLIAYPEDNSSFYYSVESEVVNLSGMALYEVYFEWFDFMEEARFAEGSQAVMFTFSPAVNQYFLWEGGSPYVRFSDVGYDTDGSSITSLDDIIVSQSVGESVSTDLTTSVSLYLDFDIELVSDGTAHYYFFDWDAGTASRVATADYLRYTLHGEDIVEFTVPVEAMPYMGEGDTPTMIFSMYNGELTVGEIEAPSAEPSDDTMYAFNGIAAQSIEDGVVLSDYLFTCYLGDSDDQSSPIMADYELAITDCGGRTHITSEMVEGLNFQRVKGNGNTRDYLFNADGTVHVLKGEGGNYTDDWVIEDGLVKISYSDESESFTTYWALLDSLDDTWSIKFYENEVVDGQSSSYIWMDTIIQQDRPIVLEECYIGDAEPVEGQPIPSMSDYETAITDCGGRTHITSEMVEGLNFQRVKGNGDTRDYLFNADGTVHVLKSEGGDYIDDWAIEDGFIKISYSDDSESFTTYWALLDSMEQTWSIKFFEEETLGGVTESWIWADTVVQQDRNALQFDPTNLVLREYDSNNFFFHADGSMSYIGNDGTETYGNSWMQTSANTMVVTYENTSTEQWVLVSQTDDELTISRDGSEEVLTNVTYEGTVTVCEDGDSPWDDFTDQPSDFGTRSDYDSAVANCTVGGAQFIESDFTGNGSESSRWELIDLWEINGTVMAVVEEEVVFHSNGTGYFDDDEGLFGFDWVILNGEVTLTITEEEFIGAKDTWNKVDQDGEYITTKSFWSDPTWSNPAPAEGEAEIFSGVMRFVGFESP